jgi:hypothetical protein
MHEWAAKCVAAVPGGRYQKMNAIARAEKARELPLGHYERAQAQSLLESEYRLCHEVQNCLPKMWLLPEEVASLYGQLVTMLGIRKVRRVVFESAEVQPGAAAHYSNREVHFRCSESSLIVALHEFTHHVQNQGGFTGGHGRGFLEAFELVLMAWLEVKGTFSTKNRRG